MNSPMVWTIKSDGQGRDVRDCEDRDLSPVVRPKPAMDGLEARVGMLCYEARFSTRSPTLVSSARSDDTRISYNWVRYLSSLSGAGTFTVSEAYFISARDVACYLDPGPKEQV